MAVKLITISGLCFPLTLLDNPIGGGKWGELGYLSDIDRQKVLSLPYGQFKPACEALKKAIKERKKKK